MSRRMKRILTIAIASAALCALAGWLFLTFVLIRPVSYQPAVDVGTVVLRSWPEHDAIYQQTQFPNVLEIGQGPGKLLYFGARHTSDAADPQLAELERRWAKFQPTVALCEGRERMSRFATRPSSGRFSESRLVRILAYRAGVPLYTLEPEYEDEVAGLLRQHDAKLVATYLTLRVFTSEAKGFQGDRDALAEGLMRKRTDTAGLRSAFASTAEFDVHWRERFAGAPDWRGLEDTESVPLLREVGDVSRQIRGDHMVRSLVELVGRGERVFAVVGASHVIRQEPFLLQALGAK